MIFLNVITVFARFFFYIGHKDDRSTKLFEHYPSSRQRSRTVNALTPFHRDVTLIILTVQIGSSSSRIPVLYDCVSRVVERTGLSWSVPIDLVNTKLQNK
jgi:hypothetical protein